MEREVSTLKLSLLALLSVAALIWIDSARAQTCTELAVSWTNGIPDADIARSEVDLIGPEPQQVAVQGPNTSTLIVVCTQGEYEARVRHVAVDGAYDFPESAWATSGPFVVAPATVPGAPIDITIGQTKLRD
jgi:hypothetical protein